MISPELMLTLSAMLMVITALVHSIVGEKKLIKPILDLRELQQVLVLGEENKPHIMKRRQPRRVLRFAWHITSVLMVLSALLVIWPDVPLALIAITGAIWLIAGIVDAIYTKGKHIGWPLLTAAGALALAAVYYLAGIAI
jgi:hypothetical protein